MSKKTKTPSGHSRDIIPSQTALALVIHSLRGWQHKGLAEVIVARRSNQPELAKSLCEQADDYDQVATFLEARLAELDAAAEV